MLICIKCKAPLPESAVYCPACGKRQAPDPKAKKPIKRANGTGTVYKLIDARRRRPWVAEKDGIIINCFETKTAATEELNKYTKKSVPDRLNITIDAAHELWMGEHYRELMFKGKEMYDVAWKHLDKLYGKKLRELRTEDLQEVIDLMDGLSRSSMAKVKQLLSQLFQWGMREDVVDRNYAEYIKLPKEKKSEKVIFSDADIAVLNTNSADPAVRIILLLIYTGLRIGELMTVLRANVFPDKGYLVAGIKTEAGRDRVIPISEKALPCLLPLYAASEGKELLIDGYEGNKNIRNFRARDFTPTLDRLGINDPPKTPHSTRHTFASLAVRAGVKPELLQEIIGHANYSTTADIYVHTNIVELKKEMEKL